MMYTPVWVGFKRGWRLPEGAALVLSFSGIRFPRLIPAPRRAASLPAISTSGAGSATEKVIVSCSGDPGWAMTDRRISHSASKKGHKRLDEERMWGFFDAMVNREE